MCDNMSAKREIIRGFKSKSELTDTDARQLARLIEQRGHFCADPQYYKNEKHFHPLIVVGMPTDEDAYEIAEKFGHTTQVQGYCWTVSRNLEVIALLNRIIPYLEIKRKKAEKALEMANTVKNKAKRWKERTIELAEEMNEF